MSTPDATGHEPTPLEKRTLLLLLALVSAALAWILLPFYGTILWGTIIALLFAPMYRRLLPRLAQRRTPAALLTLLLVLVIGRRVLLSHRRLVAGRCARRPGACS